MIRRFLRNYLAYLRDNTYYTGPANLYDWFTALLMLIFIALLFYLGGLAEATLA